VLLKVSMPIWSEPYVIRVFCHGQGFALFSHQSPSVGTKMLPSDPFPIELCSPRLRTAILAEFNGRPPTFQDVLSIPLEQWLTVPGMGRKLLTELESLTHSPLPVSRNTPPPKPDNAELITRIERFQHDLKRLQHDIQVLLGETPSTKAGTNGSDLH
jgi:hypothetical protein